MKTAMQELRDDLIQIFNDNNIPIVLQIDKYLKKEKEQIMRDYKNGKVEAQMPNEVNTTGTEYYNQTYNQNK